MQALADPSRWSIVQYLSNTEATIGALASALGLSVACMSRHVSILREAELVRVERRGREVACRLAIPGSTAGRLLRELGIEDHAPVLRRPVAPEASGRRAGRPAPAIPELESTTSPKMSRYKSNDMDDFLL